MKRRDFIGGLLAAGALLSPGLRAAARRRIVVVGAGIAGLVAAARARRLGFDVVVLEAADRVGGRMSTDRVDGLVIDRGAQFLATSYAVLGRWVRELDLGSALATTEPWRGTVRDGRVRRVRAGSPRSLLASGLLSPAAWTRLGWVHFGSQERLQGLSTSDYSAWSAYDDRDALAWATEEYGEEVTRYLIEPDLQGLFFQSLEGMSRALPMSILALNYHNVAAQTLAGGIGRLPEALAAGLDVRYGQAVTAVTASARGVTVSTAATTLHADAAVLAVPAPVARRLYAQADGGEQALLATGYSSTIVMALSCDRRWNDAPPLERLYGLFVPAAERRIVASVGMESAKGADRAGKGELLNVMLTGSAAARLMAATDEQIRRQAVDELQQYLPGLAASVRSARLYRWREAEPLSPPGRSRAIAAYRRREPGARIVLCGDYMGMPHTEGAAESAEWALRQVAATVLG